MSRNEEFANSVRYHGSPYSLKVGDLITPGKGSNGYVYSTTDPDYAHYQGRIADSVIAQRKPPQGVRAKPDLFATVYTVEPTGKEIASSYHHNDAGEEHATYISKEPYRVTGLLHRGLFGPTPEANEWPNTSGRETNIDGTPKKRRVDTKVGNVTTTTWED